jgi:Kef-type K+ transport system membrane component KefB/nucleotide-binding universal stress UspA family protein
MPPHATASSLHVLPRSALIAAAVLLSASCLALAAAEPAEKGPSEVLFIGQLIVLITVGRLLGELMLRIGQPAVMGQLIAGLLLGPSVFGALLPNVQHALFPPNAAQKAMVDAISQFGILLLLLLTGMETDLKLVRRTGRASVLASVTGIAIPFACGFALGEYLPEFLLPDPGKRLVTALFLGTALSIASVKIVAMVVREMNFLRRTVGQVIIASAIIDDSVGWIIVSIIFGIAAHGAVELGSLAGSVLGTLLFLALSLTIGRRLVFFAIRWVNDTFVSEYAVVTAILVIMGLMAAITHLIGVHTVLGAFVAGILVGESPILTEHVDEQLRGLITAFFAPVFFGMAGLTADLTILKDPQLALLTAGFIVIASVGKFTGAFIGAELGGLSRREGFALACGMNARGSTEIIVATIGLSMGALNENLFTIIVTMAVLTTMAMPPSLRWALSRVPLGQKEKERIAREEIESKGFVGNLERLLLAVDDSENAKFASRIAGLLSGTQAKPITVLHIKPNDTSRRKTESNAEARAQADAAGRLVRQAAEQIRNKQEATEKEAQPIDVTTIVHEKPTADIVAKEAEKGYDLFLIGLEKTAQTDQFAPAVIELAKGFEGPLAVTIARDRHLKEPLTGELNILVPINGTEPSRRAAEVAITMARATHAPITALYVATRDGGERRKNGRTVAARRPERQILDDIERLAKSYDVPIHTAVLADIAPDEAILQEAERRNYNVIVMGVSRRPGDTLFFGDTAASVMEHAKRSIVFVGS